jgi:hypothetical protein
MYWYACVLIPYTMKNNLFILYIALLFPLLLQAQTGSIWRMGTNNGNQKEFNFNPPNPIYSQNCANGCNSPEGNSTMDDGNGNVILQSTGSDVYDGNWNVLPSGNAIGRGAGASNGSLILQHLGNASLYYVFSVDAGTNLNDDTLAVGLQYAVVDISLNGGTGGVISKHNVLTDSAYEKMSCTRHCNGVDWWLVVNKWGTNAYYSFKISAAGVDTVPVISHAGMVMSDTLAGYAFSFSYRAGSMRISPNGKWLGNRTKGSNGRGRNLQLFSFNNQTGMVGPRLFLDSIGNSLEDVFCFSPNSNKLYSAEDGSGINEWGKNLVVYDLSSLDSTIIAASEMGLLADTNSIYFNGGIQIGIDGMLYVVTDYAPSYITIIDNPDADSADIVMHLNQIPIGYSTFHNFTQFPDCIFARKHQGVLRTRKCSYGLENETIILDTMLNVVHEFLWDFGDPASGVNNTSTERNPYHEFSAPGTYTISLTLHNACNQFTVTQQFIYNFVTVNAGTDATICAGDTAFLSANATGGSNNFLWQPSNLLNDSLSNTPFATPSSTTLFIASHQPSGCVDTLMVTVNSIAIPIITQVGFNLGSTNATSYQWYVNGVAVLGATLQEHFPSQTGNYTVVTTDINGCAAESVPFNVTVVGVNDLQSSNTVLYPNPAREILNITTKTKYTSYIIYNSLGAILMQNNFSSTINIKQLPQGVYMLELMGEKGIEQKMWVKE